MKRAFLGIAALALLFGSSSVASAQSIHNHGGYRSPGYSGHYDYHPGGYVPHRGHYDYVPSHYDYHRGSHYSGGYFSGSGYSVGGSYSNPDYGVGGYYANPRTNFGASFGPPSIRNGGLSNHPNHR